MKEYRLAIVAIAFSAIMVLGVLSIPSSSASTIKRVNPDLNYWSPSVSVYSKFGGAGSNWGYTAGTSGTSRVMNTAQYSVGGGIGTTTLSMMYEFKTQSYYCSQSATYTLWFYWQTYVECWMVDTSPLCECRSEGRRLYRWRRVRFNLRLGWLGFARST